MRSGRVGFLWWPTGVDKEFYKAKIKLAWAKLVEKIGNFLEESSQRVRGFFITYPRKRRSVGGRRIRRMDRMKFLVRVEE